MSGGTTHSTTQNNAGTVGCRTRFAGLAAPGMPVERLGRLAQSLGLAPVAEPAGPAALAVLLTGAAPGSDADELWLPPIAAWIEPPAGSDAAGLAPLLAEAAGNDLYLNLTTATAHDLQLGGRLLAALNARYPLDGDRRDDLELALHEAVSNALVHGNLGVAGMKELSAQELERFSRDLGDSLADPALAARRIVIALRIDPATDGPAEDGPAQDGRALATVEVADEGAGFIPGPRTSSGASGRGLDLIGNIAEELEIGNGGRSIRLRFRL
ncbi:Histidine kinase-like ATPase domain-containing protein [Azospirillum oryzae]|uniref:Histidine kinase-like ATPase domain-containing protein n=1 Tax=Azospirillum oryzae TaxID=286727 RepID=A0A1X7H9W7_9PROT|nr:ATP-binding protein [Azospirillum oryzae]SMF82451.1 Histidine kinase-like ATPase domain-containing protein [Azospirillum oryzae]